MRCFARVPGVRGYLPPQLGSYLEGIVTSELLCFGVDGFLEERPEARVKKAVSVAVKPVPRTHGPSPSLSTLSHVFIWLASRGQRDQFLCRSEVKPWRTWRTLVLRRTCEGKGIGWIRARWQTTIAHAVSGLAYDERQILDKSRPNPTFYHRRSARFCCLPLVFRIREHACSAA